MSGTVEIRNPLYAKIPASAGMQSLDFPHLDPDQPFRLAFLSNQKPNTEPLIELVEKELRDHFSAIEIRKFYKDTGAMPAPAETIAELGEYADLAIFSTAD